MYHKHGGSGTRLYKIWQAMKCRCLDSNHPTYRRYGARGITIHNEWVDDFETFRNWATKHGYADDLELDRIDVNGNYEPQNCRWITHHEQTMNRRDTLYVEIDGKRMKLRDLARERNVSINSINDWRYRNVLEEKLAERLGTPVRVYGGKKVVIER